MCRKLWYVCVYGAVKIVAWVDRCREIFRFSDRASPLIKTTSSSSSYSSSVPGGESSMWKCICATRVVSCVSDRISMFISPGQLPNESDIFLRTPFQAFFALTISHLIVKKIKLKTALV